MPVLKNLFCLKFYYCFKKKNVYIKWGFFKLKNLHGILSLRLAENY